MSQQGAPGPANGQPGNPQQRAQPMYKPEQMRSLTMFSVEERTTYEKGLANLWAKFENPKDEQEKALYKKKIIDFGPILVKKVNERKMQQAQQQAQQQINQQQQQGGQPPAQNAGGQPNPAATNPNPQAATAAPTRGPGMIQMPPTTAAQQMAPAAPAGPQQTGQAQQGQQGLSPAIRQHLSQMTWNPPQGVIVKGPEAVQKWIADAKKRYAQSLVNMESSRTQMARIEALIKSRAEKGQPTPPEEQKLFAEKKQVFQKHYDDAAKFVDIYRRSQQQIANANGTAGSGGAGGAPGAGPQAQAMKQEQSNQGMAAGMQGQQADINGAFEAAKKESIAAGNRLPGATGLPQGLQQQAQGPTAASPTGQAQVKLEPGSQQRPHPPPINTQIPAGATSAPNTAQLNSAAAMQQQLQAQQQAHLQRVQTPQTATQPQNTGASGVPLSHQKAIEQANLRIRANSQTGSMSAQGGQVPATSAGTPQSGGGSNSAGVIGTAAQQPQPQPQQGVGAHPHPHPPTTQALQAKLPIPKQLPERATQPPVAVSLGGGMAPQRPTLTGGSGIAGGVMNQPVVAKTPAVTMESDSERVMNKKKLDELVRQVCGGTAEDQETNLLSAEVEESVLNLADSFVDNVLHTACRNAKERGSKVLEIRDIQLVLERSYNIRIPGFSSDELRTIRKVQPSPAWIAKMSAVQAAKVTQGKGDV